MIRSLALGFALAALGCSFTEIPPPPGSVARNSCEADDECSSGRCRNEMCVSASTGLSTLLLEVAAPQDVADVGGFTFYTSVSSPRGNLAIGPAGTVTASVGAMVDSLCSFEGPAPLRAAYAPSGGTIPASISFFPSQRVLGIAAPTYTSGTGPAEDPMIGDRYTATMKIPPGTYDLYIQPRPVSTPPAGVSPQCNVPPLFVRGQEISGSLALAVALPAPTTFPLTVRGPAGDRSLAGWSVDVLDSESGRVLSAKTLLPEPTLTETSSEYATQVAFVPAQVVSDGALEPDDAYAGVEIVRLSPPKHAVAPSFFFEREGLGIFGETYMIDLVPPSGYVPGGTAIPENAAIEGQTTVLETGIPVAAAVTLTATQIDGASNNASFTTTIQVSEDGKFAVSVPPGTYNVRATPPPSLGLAAAEDVWEVRATLQGEGGVQAGKTIELPRAPLVWGEAVANGRPVFGATARTVVSPRIVKTNVIERTLEPAPVAPRTSSDLVAGDGRFDVPVDPGTYDFFVQPEARSRFPWLVLPFVEVPAGGVSLGRRRVTLPFVYGGDVVVDATTTRVPGALIRAYVYVTADGAYTSDASKSVAVVPVAETRADDNGTFELLIPASLDER